jgi:hypothetical protein
MVVLSCPVCCAVSVTRRGLRLVLGLGLGVRVRIKRQLFFKKQLASNQFTADPYIVSYGRCKPRDKTRQQKR